MGNIYEQGRVSTVSLADLLPVWVNRNSDTRSIAISDLVDALSGLLNTSFAQQLAPISSKAVFTSLLPTLSDGYYQVTRDESISGSPRTLYSVTNHVATLSYVYDDPGNVASGRVVRLRGDTASNISAYTPQIRELLEDLQGRLYTGDGSKLGGYEGGALIETLTGAVTNSIAQAVRDIRPVDLKRFGIKGDGTDETTKLLAAFASGETLRAGAGTFGTTTNLVATGGLIGAGIAATQFKMLGTANGVISVASATKGIFQDFNVLAASGIRGTGFDLTTSSQNIVNRVKVSGFLGSPVTGLVGIGFSGNGSDNVLMACRAEGNTFGMAIGGTRNKILYSYATNGFQANGTKPWTSSSNYYDGISIEGSIDNVVLGCVSEDNGQSGIYVGGNGFYCAGAVIVGNKTRNNWNRGLDLGVSGVRTAGNDVRGPVIMGNSSFNNRENNLWMCAIQRARAIGNHCEYTSAYSTLFAGNAGGHVNIALTDNANSQTSDDCVIDGNIAVDDTDQFALTLATLGSGNIVSSSNRLKKLAGSTALVYYPSATALINNTLEIPVTGNFTVAAVCGSGTATLTANLSSYRVEGRRVSYTIQANVTAVSAPSGSLVLRFLYLPATTQQSQVQIETFTGLNTSLANSTLQAALVGGTSDQIQVIRTINGSSIFDVSSFLQVGSMITIKATIEF